MGGLDTFVVQSIALVGPDAGGVDTFVVVHLGGFAPTAALGALLVAIPVNGRRKTERVQRGPLSVGLGGGVPEFPQHQLDHFGVQHIIRVGIHCGVPRVRAGRMAGSGVIGQAGLV